MSENNVPPRKEPVRLHIHLDEATAQGTYVNLCMVNHTDGEFTLDFIYVQPQQPKAKVRARMITNPRHAKRLMLALQENVKRFEDRFGKIELGEPGPEPIVH